MKRTKQTYFRDFPTESGTHELSGCREFEGEDLKHDARKQFFKNKQKQWLDQQIQQKRQRQERQKYEEMMYTQQTLELNRMRGMLEDNFQNTKNNILHNHVDTNKKLNLELREKEQAEKDANRQYQRDQVEYLKQRGAKQDFYMDVK